MVLVLQQTVLRRAINSTCIGRPIIEAVGSVRAMDFRVTSAWTRRCRAHFATKHDVADRRNKFDANHAGFRDQRAGRARVLAAPADSMSIEQLQEAYHDRPGFLQGRRRGSAHGGGITGETTWAEANRRTGVEAAATRPCWSRCFVLLILRLRRVLREP